MRFCPFDDIVAGVDLVPLCSWDLRGPMHTHTQATR